MKIRTSAVAALALMPFLFACSSTDDEVDGNQPSNVDPGDTGGTCDPTGKIPCIEKLAEPCENFNSGFDGDEYCMKPPPVGEGLQLHVGPTDYTDPEETD